MDELVNIFGDDCSSVQIVQTVNKDDLSPLKNVLKNLRLEVMIFTRALWQDMKHKNSEMKR